MAVTKWQTDVQALLFGITAFKLATNELLIGCLVSAVIWFGVGDKIAARLTRRAEANLVREPIR